MPVIIGPTPYFWVEPTDQIGSGHAQRGFDISADTIQKGLNVLFGRLDEQFPMGILAHVLSEKIKTSLHVGDDCLRRGKFYAAGGMFMAIGVLMALRKYVPPRCSKLSCALSD